MTLASLGAMLLRTPLLLSEPASRPVKRGPGPQSRVGSGGVGGSAGLAGCTGPGRGAAGAAECGRVGGPVQLEAAAAPRDAGWMGNCSDR